MFRHHYAAGRMTGVCIDANIFLEISEPEEDPGV